MKTEFKYLQKIFYLLLVGISFCAVQACSSDDDDDAGKSVFVDGHEAVDLGLSVKWATCNVGADTPTEYGNYYAWGETVTKSNYDWETYKWCKGDDESLTKYCNSIDGKSTLSASDDVATVKWGAKWRMPSQKEWEELLDKCTITWTSQNRVYGCLVVGPSGKSIFLPASGSYIGEQLRHVDSYGSYWSSTLYKEFENQASTFSFDIDEIGWDNSIEYDSALRCFGFPVRPVTQ